MVSLSSAVDPAFREYERTCVTAFDAYIKPRLDRYLAGMENDLKRSGHTRTSSDHAIERRSVFFGYRPPTTSATVPVGAGGRRYRCLFGRRRSPIEGPDNRRYRRHQFRYRPDFSTASPWFRPEGSLDTYSIRVPMVDVNAIGAGGGSIAWIDEAGGLRVGPKSAGADPGPACYGRGGEWATVTDASVALGYIDPGYFAGGSLKLDPDRARVVIDSVVAKPLGLSLDHAALGIHRVVNAQMAEGIRLVSISRGIDPRQFALVALGGAGPLHATALASELGISTVVVPRNPGVLSAIGLLSATTEHEVSAAFSPCPVRTFNGPRPDRSG